MAKLRLTPKPLYAELVALFDAVDSLKDDRPDLRDAMADIRYRCEQLAHAYSGLSFPHELSTEGDDR